MFYCKKIDCFFNLRAMFLAGEMMSSSDLIPKFIALLCQITKGDFVSKE